MNIRDYIIDRELGRGGFGVTYLGYDNKTRNPVAIKTIKLSGKSKLEEINEEIRMLADLTGDKCNKYIACYYDSFQDYVDGEDTVFIVSEYVDGMSLADFMERYQGNIPPNILWSIYTQLLLGLKYIHDNGYAHRDIKPENILITNDYVIKYIDFGLSCVERCKMKECTSTCPNNTNSGTILYMPPEFYNKNIKTDLEGSQSRDIWALTMVMFELAHGLYVYPFNTNNSSQEEIMKNISLAPTYAAGYTLDDGRTNLFLDAIIINDWRKRPTVDQCIDLLLNIIFAPVLF